jgi:NitT/TauT family transport system permease protein
MKAGWIRTVVPPIATFVLLTLVAEGLIKVFHVPRWLLPAPHQVLVAISNRAGDLWHQAMLTGRAALAAFAMAGIFGVLLAIFFSLSRWIERAFYPYTIFFQTVPIIAIAPLLAIWFGLGFRAVTMAAFIVGVFPVIANTLAGLRSVEPPLHDLFRLYGADPWQKLIKLSLPSALPNIVTGLRVAAGLCVIGTIVGEFVAGKGQGLGIVVMESMRQGQTDMLFAAVLVASLLGLVMFAFVQLSGYLLLRRWHSSEQ